MATFLCTVKIVKGKEQEFEALARHLFACTRKLEPGCSAYGFYRAKAERTYYSLAAFEDYGAFLNHQNSEYHEAPDWLALLEDVRLEWIDPIAGASEFNPTNPVELSPDASEGERKYAQEFPIIVEDWWRVMRLATGDRSGGEAAD